MNSRDLIDEAYDETKVGGDTERAQVLSMLAVAAALAELTDEVRGIGTEAQPVHVADVSSLSL